MLIIYQSAVRCGCNCIMAYCLNINFLTLPYSSGSTFYFYVIQAKVSKRISVIIANAFKHKTGILLYISCYPICKVNICEYKTPNHICISCSTIQYSCFRICISCKSIDKVNEGIQCFCFRICNSCNRIYKVSDRNFKVPTCIQLSCYCIQKVDTCKNETTKTKRNEEANAQKNTLLKNASSHPSLKKEIFIFLQSTGLLLTCTDIASNVNRFYQVCADETDSSSWEKQTSS